MNFNYSLLIKKAWNIAWKNRLLWVFGFFIASGVEGAAYGDNFRLSEIQDRAMEMINYAKSTILTMSIVGIVLALVIFIISIVCQSAIIKGIDNVSRKTKNAFKQLWSFGVSKFWRVLGLNAVFGIGVLLLLSPAILMLMDQVWAGIIGGLWMLLIIVALVVFGNFFYYAYAYAIIEDKTISQSLGQGWKLYKDNFKVSFLVSLLRVGLSIVFAIGLTIAVFILLLPFVLLGFLFGMLTGALGAMIIAIIGGIAVFAFIIIFRGFVNTFHYSLSLYTYMELIGRKVLIEEKKK